MSRKVTDAIQSIKVGTTRATLLKIFEAEGGLFSSTDGRPILGLNDKITKVSKPYLEFVFRGD